MDWLSNLFGGITKALGGAGKSISQGVGNLFGGASNIAGNAVQGATKAGQSVGQNIFSGLSNVGSNVSKGASSIMNNFGLGNQASTSAKTVYPGVSNVSGAGQSQINQITSPFQSTSQLLKPQAMSQFQTPKTQVPSSGGFNFNLGGGSQATNNVMSNYMQQAAQSAPQVTAASTTAPSSTPFMGGLFGQNPMQTLGGAALSLGGQMFSRTPKIPDLSQLPSYQALKNVNFSNFQELDPALETALNNDLKVAEDKEMREFVAAYKNLRPGADIENDSVFKRDRQELLDSQAQRRSDTLAKARYDFISQQIGANQQEMNKLVQLAQTDINQVMAQLGIDSQAAQNFQDIFNSLGKQMMSSGMGSNTMDFSKIFNLGGGQ